MPSKEKLSSFKLFLLTVCLAGIQFTWTVELAYGTPYLISLGLSSAWTALVWVAGPLSGLIIQPVVGAYSDQLTWKYGRRKPFIIVGGIALIFSVCLIAYNYEILSCFLDQDSNYFKSCQIGLAVLAFYSLDFSVNAVTCSCRSLILDVTPVEQQQTANALGAFQLGVGNIIGYLSGFLDLPSLFPFLGDTQIKVLCLINIIWLTILLSTTLISITEISIDNKVDSPTQKAWWMPLNHLFKGIRHLPQEIQNICNVQLVGWLAWFPFLFYCTSWVARFAKSGVSGERLGSLALFTKSLVSIIAVLLVPRLRGWKRIGLPEIWAVSFWLLGICLLCTYFVSSDIGAVLIPTVIGICWGLTQWIPFALIGEFVSITGRNNEYERVSMENIDEDGDFEPQVSSPLTLDAGMVLGIHNIYIVIPQFISTFVCSVLFKISEVAAPDSDPDQYGLVLRAGGFAAIFAGFLCLKVKEISGDEQFDKAD